MTFEVFTQMIIGISAVFFIILASIMRTHNSMSALLFKFVPMMLGICSLFISLKMAGIL